jgi:hypothetical protein
MLHSGSAHACVCSFDLVSGTMLRAIEANPLDTDRDSSTATNFAESINFPSLQKIRTHQKLCQRAATRSHDR